MPPVDSMLISPSLRAAVPTKVDRVLPATSVSGNDSRQQWQRLIDESLIEWALHPDQFEDEYTPPSWDTISLASTIAKRLAVAGEPAPNRVVTDANGGIVFESRASTVFESIRVSAELTIEYCKFVDGRLVSREPWQID